MKKVILVILSFVICVGTTFTILFVVKNKNNIIYAENLLLNKSSITLKVNEYYTFTSNDYIIMPKNCTEKIFLSTNDSSVLDINILCGKIYTKSCGQCKLNINIKSCETKFISKSIDFIVTESGDVSNDEEIKDEETTMLTFKLNDTSTILPYDTKNQLGDCKFSLSVQNIIEVIEFNYKSIVICFLSKGNVKLIVDSPSKKTIFDIIIV